jgi:carbon-monoxide dehydrogenase medium subunit
MVGVGRKVSLKGEDPRPGRAGVERREHVFPGPFAYEAPHDLEQALGLLAQYGEDAKVLAGGQSLLPMMKLRVVSPQVLVDVGAVAQLKGLDEGEEGLTLGALTRHVDLERLEPPLSRRYPLLPATARWVADPLVRRRGTLGGSLAHADPAADWGAALCALHGSVTVQGPSGVRHIPADELFVDTFTTSLAPGEILTQVHLPRPAGRAWGRYLKLERKVGDFAVTAVAVHVVLDEAGTVVEAGLGLCAVGPTPLRAKEAEKVLVGSTLSREAIREAAHRAAQASDPVSDTRGSADYKRDMVRVLVQRGLLEVAQEAGIWQDAS